MSTVSDYVGRPQPNAILDDVAGVIFDDAGCHVWRRGARRARRIDAAGLDALLLRFSDDVAQARLCGEDGDVGDVETQGDAMAGDRWE